MDHTNIVPLDEAGLDWGNLVEMTSYNVGIQDHIYLFRQVLRASLVISR